MPHALRLCIAALFTVSVASHASAHSPVGCSSDFLYSGFNSLGSRTSTAAIVAAPEVTETMSGDFNVDGVADLSVTLSQGFRQSTPGFSLQLGNGDGTFGQSVFARWDVHPANGDHSQFRKSMTSLSGTTTTTIVWQICLSGLEIRMSQACSA